MVLTLDLTDKWESAPLPWKNMISFTLDRCYRLGFELTQELINDALTKYQGRYIPPEYDPMGNRACSAKLEFKTNGGYLLWITRWSSPCN